MITFVPRTAAGPLDWAILITRQLAGRRDSKGHF